MRALFTLAAKVSPTVIFIDEVIFQLVYLLDVYFENEGSNAYISNLTRRLKKFIGLP